MTRYILKAALALGAVLAVGGAASAGDRDTPLPAGGAPSTTMTLGGKGTVEQAATEDTELARGYRGGYYGGHYGGYGYGGYRGYYGSYYRPAYYGGYYGSFYRPAYYYSPRVYYSGYYSYPVYPTYYSSGIFIGIGGGATTGAPAVPLGVPAQQPMVAPVAPGDGTFRYDGGPANPVPVPKAEPMSMAPNAATTNLPVSLKGKPATSPYKYKAYGEK